MFADVEVISNNTYGYNQFTYSIPHKFMTKLSIGSFVKVEFRNKIVDALVVNLKSKTEIKNPKNILKISRHLFMEKIENFLIKNLEVKLILKIL